ncbi:hypothetical protein, partial [Escherichia coli]|uniref:hypothetical protein n=1 Tax=Escherichia coli TaxID=562 RepID=UPI001E336A65
LMMSLWDALRMNMMISYQELVRTFPSLFMLVPFSNHSWSNDRIRERAFSSFWELNSYPKLRLIIVDRWVD